MEISISYNSNKITKEIMTGTDIPSRKVSYVKASSRRVKVQESTCIGYFPVFIDDKLVFFFLLLHARRTNTKQQSIIYRCYKQSFINSLL